MKILRVDLYNITGDKMNFIIEYWIQVFFGFLVCLITLLFRKIVKSYKEIKIIKLSVLELLKNEIILEYNICIKNGCIDLFEKQIIENLYLEYKKLGGNGFIEDIMHKLDNLKIDKECK